MTHIVIIGGGMGGASLALLLTQGTPYDITLVERAPLAIDTLPDTPSYDARSTALALGSAEILARIGAWDVLKRYAAPINHISVSHQGHFGAARLDAAEENVEALGFVAENRHIGLALLGALRQTRVDVRAQQTVESFQRDTDAPQWTLQLNNGESLVADLIVVADGASSGARDALGIIASEHDYDASAIICNVTPREAHEGVAFERFTRDGALAVLPLNENRCAIVWSVPNARATSLLAAGDAEFIAALSQEFGDRLGGFSRAGARSAYPLVKITASQQYVPGAVLIGNAAHLLHPVAGQGFNLTLRDAAAFAMTLTHAADEEVPPGDPALLRGYVDFRARDQQLTAGLSHGLPKLFSVRDPFVAMARDAGLLAFDLLTPLKREFARQAMGVGVFTGGVSRG